MYTARKGWRACGYISTRYRVLVRLYSLICGNPVRPRVKTEYSGNATVRYVTRVSSYRSHTYNLRHSRDNDVCWVILYCVVYMVSNLLSSRSKSGQKLIAPRLHQRGYIISREIEEFDGRSADKEREREREVYTLTRVHALLMSGPTLGNDHTGRVQFRIKRTN